MWLPLDIERGEMEPIEYYLGSGGLLGVAFMLIRQASPFGDLGCFDYERRLARRLIGIVALVAAAICLVIGLLDQLSATAG